MVEDCNDREIVVVVPGGDENNDRLEEKSCEDDNEKGCDVDISSDADADDMTKEVEYDDM